jgi:hypothetical protein
LNFQLLMFSITRRRSCSSLLAFFFTLSVAGSLRRRIQKGEDVRQGQARGSTRQADRSDVDGRLDGRAGKSARAERTLTLIA